MHKITVDRINELVDGRLSGKLDAPAMEASGTAARDDLAVFASRADAMRWLLLEFARHPSGSWCL